MANNSMQPNEDEIDNFENPNDEQDQVYFIKKYLRSDADKKWLNDNDYSIEDILTCNYKISDSKAVTLMLLKWNEKLESFGMKSSFHAIDAEAMIGEIDKTMKSFGIEKWEFG